MGATPMPPEQEQVLATIKQAKKGRGRPPIPENEIVAIARRYNALKQRGERNLHAKLAAEFSLSKDQIRDRIHKARNTGYLAKTKQGRADGRLGPKLASPSD
jgi:predicted ABC-type ATPase